jgi:hypothetical protein
MSLGSADLRVADGVKEDYERRRGRDDIVSSVIETAVTGGECLKILERTS